MINWHILFALELTIPLLLGFGYLISRLGTKSLYEPQRSFKESVREAWKGTKGNLPVTLLIAIWPPELTENLFNPLLIVALFVALDFYFFLVHRLLHTRPFLKVHRVHHEVVRTNSLEGLVLHPVEYFLHSLVFLLLYIVPVGLGDIVILFILYNTIVLAGHHHKNILGHFKYLHNSETHHMHHINSQVNYGFFTNIYDRLTGTFKEIK